VKSDYQKLSEELKWKLISPCRVNTTKIATYNGERYRNRVRKMCSISIWIGLWIVKSLKTKKWWLKKYVLGCHICWLTGWDAVCFGKLDNDRSVIVSNNIFNARLSYSVIIFIMSPSLVTYGRPITQILCGFGYSFLYHSYSSGYNRYW